MTMSYQVQKLLRRAGCALEVVESVNSDETTENAFRLRDSTTGRTIRDGRNDTFESLEDAYAELRMRA